MYPKESNLIHETVKNFVYGNPPSKGKINLRRRVLKCQGKDKKQIEQK